MTDTIVKAVCQHCQRVTTVPSEAIKAAQSALAEHVLGQLLSALEDILPMAEEKWANPDAIAEIAFARSLLKSTRAALATATEGRGE